MAPRSNRLAASLAPLVALLACACGEPDTPKSGGGAPVRPTPDAYANDTPMTIAYGGDTVTGRYLNTFVLERSLEQPLQGVKPVLEQADVAVVNLESLLATTGTWSDKNDRGAVHLRGRPELVQVLTSAGVDVALAANNHTTDYGTGAMLEHLDILRRSGIDPIGAGKNLSAAMRPVYRKVGETVVGFIGIHTSSTRGSARKRRAGANFVNENDADRLVRRVRGQVKRARKYAHVVVLVIHWGPPDVNPEASEVHRELARRFVEEADIDALLGSSVHVMQGVEVIDGRPIVYDAGNLLLDWPRRGGKEFWIHRCGIFVLHATRAGVVRLEFVPILLGHAETQLAKRKGKREVKRILDRLQKLSGAMGTKFEIQHGRAFLALEREPPPAPRRAYTPRERPPATPVTADSYVPPVIETDLPEHTTPLCVEFEGGIELIGVDLRKKVPPRQGLVMSTYWTTSKPIEHHYQVAYYARCDDKMIDPGAKCSRDWRTSHQPADWLYPTTRWEPGEIVRDSYFVRGPMKGGGGTYQVEVALIHGRRKLEIVKPAYAAGKTTFQVGLVDIEDNEAPPFAPAEQ